jgi:hypothetical protein
MVPMMPGYKSKATTMSKFSQVNRPRGIRETLEHEAHTFRLKRDAALKRHLLTPDDIEAVSSLDGLTPGFTAFLASNNPARLHFTEGLARQVFWVSEALPELQFLHVTIINETFETSDEQTTLQIKAITDEARDILGAMSSDWIAAVELSVFANRRHALGGKIISPHVHATLWGHDIHQRGRQVAERYNARLTAGVKGCEAVKVQLACARPADLERIVAYPYRAPVRTKTVYYNPETGHTNLHESEKGDRYVRYLRMYQLLSLIQQDHMSFAAGDGVAIRRRALAAVHQNLELATQRNSSRADQMGWIAEFWQEFMPRMGFARFKMPKVITR